jgi:CAAX protease family protein
LNARALFVTSTGALRPPWRLAIFVVLLVALGIASVGLTAPIFAWLFRLVGAQGVTTESWVTLTVALAATAICVLAIDKRSWSYVWLGADAARPRPIVGGFVLGMLCIGVPAALLIARGWLGDQGGGNGSWWTAMMRISLVLLPAALFEELIIRGYLLAVLREWLGWGWAILVTSAGFGLLHLTNPGANAESLALVTLAGVFLAAVLYVTRSLYAAWAAHFAWNWTLAVIFHASVSGYPFESPGYRYVDAGPDWATGGVWGPEGGLPAALGMVAGIAILLRRRRAAEAATASKPALRSASDMGTGDNDTTHVGNG